MKGFAALAVSGVLVAGGLSVAMSTTPARADPTNYIALAMSDGPSADRRVVVSFRGTEPDAVIRSAFRACYERAADGYLHTCKVWYGDAWIVGELCQQTPSHVAFAIGDDANSPEAARAKALAYLSDVEHVDTKACRTVAEFNANDVRTARSAAKDIGK